MPYQNQPTSDDVIIISIGKVVSMYSMMRNNLIDSLIEING